MLRELKEFPGVLTKLATKPKDEHVVLVGTIKHVEITDNPFFLNSLEKIPKIKNVSSLFAYPIQWDSMNVNIESDFLLEFDSLEYEIKIMTVKVKRSFEKLVEKWTYNIDFETELIKESTTLASYVLNKEEGETGTFKTIEYGCSLTYIPPIQSEMFEEES